MVYLSRRAASAYADLSLRTESQSPREKCTCRSSQRERAHSKHNNNNNKFQLIVHDDIWGRKGEKKMIDQEGVNQKKA